jgi:hypothetical protein
MSRLIPRLIGLLLLGLLVHTCLTYQYLNP